MRQATSGGLLLARTGLYAKRYERDFDAGAAAAWLMSRPEREETIGAECDAVEAERTPYGPKPSYSTRELEAALFYQVMVGIRTWKATRKELAGDTGNDGPRYAAPCRLCG
jgi:hypothetical protein